MFCLSAKSRHIALERFDHWHAIFLRYRGEQWSFFGSDGIVMFFSQEPLASMVFRFSLVLLPLDHQHLMFLSLLTIAFNGFSMVFGHSAISIKCYAAHRPLPSRFFPWFLSYFTIDFNSHVPSVVGRRDVSMAHSLLIFIDIVSELFWTSFCKYVPSLTDRQVHNGQRMGVEKPALPEKPAFKMSLNEVVG